MTEQTRKDSQEVRSPTPEASSSTAAEASSRNPFHKAIKTTGEPSNSTLQGSDQEILQPWLGKTDESFIPLPLSPNWIDLDTIRGWIHTCIDEHGPECWPLETLIGLPLWLIDVKEHCLVPATAQHTYLALSYVWVKLRLLRLPGQISSLSRVPACFPLLMETSRYPRLFDTP